MSGSDFEGVWRIIANSMRRELEPEKHWARIVPLDGTRYQLQSGTSKAGPWTDEQILLYNEDTHQLENEGNDRGRCISFWQRRTEDNGLKHCIFGMRIQVDSMGHTLPWERPTNGLDADENGTWGAEEDPPP